MRKINKLEATDELQNEEEIGTKSVYQSQEFVELESAMIEQANKCKAAASSKISSFEERRKKRRSEKHNCSKLDKKFMLDKLKKLDIAALKKKMNGRKDEAA